MNDSRTSSSICAETEPRRQLWELVSYRGEIFGPYTSPEEAAEVAQLKWPEQFQDEDRTGAGWDIAVVGADR